MRVAVVFLLLARVRFPKSKSIAEVIRARYNENTVKRIRKLEKLDYHLRKAELDLEFLSTLKIKFCLYRSIDRNCPDPGGKGTFYGGHKITVLI